VAPGPTGAPQFAQKVAPSTSAAPQLGQNFPAVAMLPLRIPDPIFPIHSITDSPIA